MYPITHEGFDYLPGEKGTPAVPTPPLLDCGHPESEHSSITRGWGIMGEVQPDGSVVDKKYCYDCAAAMERECMVQHGRATLYLTKEKLERGAYRYHVKNWTGNLDFPCYYSKEGKHNIGGKRTDVWFRGPDNHVWWGWHTGEWTALIHCRRTKEILRPRKSVLEEKK